MTAHIGITLAGVELPDEAAVTARSIQHRATGELVRIEQGDGSVHVVERWTGRDLVISCSGYYPPALRALSRSALVSLTYPDLELPESESQLRTTTGLIVDGPTWTDDLYPVTSAWTLTLRECALEETPALSIGDVSVPIEARALSAAIQRTPQRAYSLLQLSDGSAVPQHAWTRARYTVSGSGWTPPGILSLDPAASITLVTADYGTVSCWLVEGPTQSWQQSETGPSYGWSITVQAQD